MPFLVDNVGETLEIKNKPADLQALLKQIDRKNGTVKIGLTEKGDRFYRLVTSQQITKGKIHPTTDNGHYFNFYMDHDGDFFGFFTGDKDVWLGILLRDGFLNSMYDIYEVEVEFPEGTPYVWGQRPISMEYMESWVDETFIIYDQSIPILAKVKISDDEINEAEEQYQEDWEKDEELDEDDFCED
jgi:hypothetical protein